MLYTRITRLPDDTEALASTELKALAQVWRERRQELDQTGAYQEFLKRLQREWAIETGIIERLYSWDRGVTEVLIEQGIDASLIAHRGGVHRDNGARQRRNGKACIPRRSPRLKCCRHGCTIDSPRSIPSRTETEELRVLWLRWCFSPRTSFLSSFEIPTARSTSLPWKPRMKGILRSLSIYLRRGNKIPSLKPWAWSIAIAVVE